MLRQLNWSLLKNPMNSSNDLFQKPLAMTFAFVVCTFLANSLTGNFV